MKGIAMNLLDLMMCNEEGEGEETIVESFLLMDLIVHED
jgi:hypothetical protein